jgi:hypothetical protein
MVPCFRSILLFLSSLIFVKLKLHDIRCAVFLTPHAKSLFSISHSTDLVADVSDGRDRLLINSV